MLRTAPRQAMPTPGTIPKSRPISSKLRNDPDIRPARNDHVRALGRHAELQIEKALLCAVQHAPDQGSRIQITDRAHPEPWEKNGGGIG